MDFQASNLINFASLPIERQEPSLADGNVRDGMTSIYERLERGYMEFPDLKSPEEHSELFNRITEVQYWGPRKLYILLY